LMSSVRSWTARATGLHFARACDVQFHGDDARPVEGDDRLELDVSAR